MNDRITALEQALVLCQIEVDRGQRNGQTGYQSGAAACRDAVNAALAASRAAPGCHQPDLVTAAQVQSLSQSRDHFKDRAEANKSRVKRLRHRQRALISALELVVKAESLSNAKMTAALAIGGWEDESLIYTARTSAALRAIGGDA